MTLQQRRPARISALLIAVLLASGAAVTAQDRFTPYHVAKLRTVISAAMSPDGRHAAYVLSVPRRPLEDPDGPAWEELHVVGTDGNSRPYVTGHVNLGGIKWTPSGDGIAFLAKREPDDTRALHVVPFAGGEARRLFKHDTDIVAFDFSENGSRMAFIARPADRKERQELARKGFTQTIYEESIQPQRLYVVEMKDGVPAGTARQIELPGHPSNLALSPDGSRLIVIHAPTPLVDDDLIGRRVWIVDTASGKITTRIENPGKLGDFGWSPDGRYIAYISGEDINDPAEGRLMVVPATGGLSKDLLPDYKAHVRQIAWEDADTIVYVADEGVWSVVGEVGIDGSGRRTLVPTGGPIFTALDRASNGTMALVGETPAHPAEVYVLPKGSGQAQRVTQSNPWLPSLRLAKQEVVTYTARDGLELQGILIHPLEQEPGKRYPLILTVHGGPESRDANGWKTSYANPGQVGAADGFAVFYPNYRGSTGRGVEFSKLGQADPAGKEFDDLVDAVDHLVKIGLVDRSKVGITGGSYGGYASAWGATYYSDRFAAAVMFVGISNKISKVGETDIPNEEFHVHARKRPWEAWQFFLERSPIYYADRSKTPTLILHGDADPRVHPSQSLELYRHLKLRGQAPVRLVWYAGEGHGNRRAASRLDYNLRLMRWMNHYLKGPGGDPPPMDLDYRLPAQITAR